MRLARVVQCPQWPENGIGFLGTGVSDSSEPPLSVLGIEHMSSGRKANSITVELALLAHKL